MLMRLVFYPGETTFLKTIDLRMSWVTAYSKNRFVIRANSIKIGVAGGFYFSGKDIKEPKSNGKIKPDFKWLQRDSNPQPLSS